MAGHLALASRRIIPMAICKNPNCQRAYQSHDGIVVVDLVRVLRANHDANTVPAPANIQGLTQLAPQIYQTGPHCGSCGQPMAMLPGPAEGQEVNDLLQNIELLQMHGVPI